MPTLFDRPALQRNRARADADALFLHDTLAAELHERLNEVNRTFTSVAIVTGFPIFWTQAFPDATIVADDEVLALEPGAHDLVLHVMALHWANDPVGQIIQSTRALRPDGLFQAVCLGGQTLHELRACLAQAESEVTGGLSPRIAPMGEIRDLGALLQRAGLALPVADSVSVRTSYTSAFHLMRDLRNFGEANALNARLRRPTKRAVFDRCAEIYAQSFAEDGKIIATFEFLFLSGWCPSADQPKPLRPGSAKQRLADALRTDETKLPL